MSYKNINSFYFITTKLNIISSLSSLYYIEDNIDKNLRYLN